MKYLMRLAFQNIIRSKIRTILTFLIITFGIMFFVVFDGMIKGFGDLNIKNVIGFDTGHFKIRSNKFDNERPFAISNYIKDWSNIETTLDKKDYVIGYTERINFIAEIDNGIDSLPVVVVGINKETDPNVYTLTNFISEGELVPNGTLIGKNLLEDMELALHDYIYITFRNIHGTITSLNLEISGIVNSADPSVNNSMLFINIDEAQAGLSTSNITEIAIRTDDYKKYKNYGIDLRASLPSQKIDSWKKLGEIAIAAADADAYGMYFFNLFIVIIGLVGIVNTMLLSVYEKRREIGMLKALGMADREVRRLFVIEGLMVGFAGTTIGIVTGVLINWYFVINGVDLTAMMGGNTDMDIGYKIMGIIKSQWNIGAIVGAFVFGVLASGIASFYPAWKTTKMKPVECLRVDQ